MTRKEMVDRIKDRIESIRGVDNGYYVYPDDDSIAEQILNVVEDSGMLPPDTGKGYPIETLTPTGNIDYGISKDNRWE